MNKPIFENFKLHSVKYLDGGGIKMKHDIAIPEEGGVVDQITGDEDITIEPSDEFKKLFRNLSPSALKVFKWDSFMTVLQNKMFNANGAQKAIAEKYVDEISKSVKVTGVQFGKWDNATTRTMSLTVIFTDESGLDVVLKTSSILLSQGYFGVEEEMEKIGQQIIEEAFKYRYEGKRQQLEIPGFKTPSPSKSKKKEVVPDADHVEVV